MYNSCMHSKVAAVVTYMKIASLEYNSYQYPPWTFALGYAFAVANLGGNVLTITASEMNCPLKFYSFKTVKKTFRRNIYLILSNW